MVVKIQNSYPSMRSTLNYNEGKVAFDQAERIAAINVDGPTLKEIRQTFARYERLNIRSTNVSFQMSINPNLAAGEKMTDDMAIKFALEIMEELGYKDQPIVIYRHFDIDREHYHVVSIRTNSKGKKIRDRQEQNKLQRFLKALSKTYGYKVGNEPSVQITKEPGPDGLSESKPNTQDSGLAAQYVGAFEKAKEYHFRTFTQFAAIMSWYGISVSKQEFNRKDIVCLQAVDSQNRGCSTPLTETELNRELLAEITARAQMCGEDRSRHLPLRREIATVVEECRKKALSLDEFKDMLKDHGIGLFLSRRKDGHIFGVTLIDHEHKIAFKGSEISALLKPELLDDFELYIPQSGLHLEKDSDPADKLGNFFGSLLDFMTVADQSMRDASSTVGRDGGMDGRKNKGKKKNKKQQY